MRRKKYIKYSLFLIIILAIVLSFDPSKDFDSYDFEKVDLSYTDSLVYNFNELIPKFKGSKAKNHKFTHTIQKNFRYGDISALIQSDYRDDRYIENFYGIGLYDTLSLRLDLKKNTTYKFCFWLPAEMHDKIIVQINGVSKKPEPVFATRLSNEYQIEFTKNLNIRFLNNIAGDSTAIFIGKPQLFMKINRSPKHVLWTVIDALRQDLFEEKYKDMIPTLYRLSREGQWYKNATNSANWTRPSTVSFLTGKFVKNISKTYSTDTFPVDSASRHFFYEKTKKTVATFFNSQNFDVVSIMNNVFLHDRNVGYEIGFPQQISYDVDDIDEEILSDNLLRYIYAHANRDLFIFFNTNTCHARYRCGVAAYFKALSNMEVHFPSSKTKYYGAAVEADEMMEHIIDNLGEMGVYNNLKMILHSDHGELLRGEEYYYKNNQKPFFKRHGGFMMPHVFNVPLIFKGFKFREDEERRVSLVDIVPSLFEYYGSNDKFDGYSLNLIKRDRSYILTGDSQFGYLNQSMVYEAYSDRVFKFTEKRFEMKEVHKSYFPDIDSVRKEYIEEFIPIKRLVFLNKKIEVVETMNLDKADDFMFKNKAYHAYEVNKFPFGIKLKGRSAYLQKTGERVNSQILENVGSNFYSKYLQESNIVNKKEDDLFFATVTTVGVSNVVQKLDSQLKDQLKKWGYIQ